MRALTGARSTTQVRRSGWRRSLACVAERRQSNADKRAELIGTARALQGIDLERLTGRTAVLRGVADFQRQLLPFTHMFDQQEKLSALFTGMSAMHSPRRDVLGTAFIASDITKSLDLARGPFIDRATRSISTFAGAQLSIAAKQAMLGKPLALTTIPSVADAQAFGALTRLTADFHKALVGAVPKRPVLGATAFAESLRRVTEPFAGGAWSFIEQLRELDELALLFVERHGWPLPLALSARTVHRVAGMADRGKREVTQFMVASFEPRSKAYRMSRDRLLDSQHFESRRQPIRQGLHALNRGHYYASVCTLLPLVEGVLVDVVLVDDPPGVGAPKKAIRQLRQTGDEVDALTVGAIETLLVSATSGAALFDQFNRRDYGGPGESRRLNRHAILHGSARRYGTHANALKLFLLLVALAETLDFYESERVASEQEEAAAA